MAGKYNLSWHGSPRGRLEKENYYEIKLLIKDGQYAGLLEIQFMGYTVVKLTFAKKIEPYGLATRLISL